MESVVGSSFGVFLFVTVLVMGFAAFITGQALANTWRPVWQVAPYCLLLGCTARFLTWSLFEGPLFALGPYLVGTGVLALICLLAHRVTQVNRMVQQYPWVYERAGPFSWREKAPE